MNWLRRCARKVIAEVTEELGVGGLLAGGLLQRVISSCTPLHIVPPLS